ncbi:MAG: ABC transporter ATP-binding protein, partial [Gemmatimonadetes bacterium]|nr:ABC transporter ATP-binding protein [Gemmatimonadota bacterium]
VATGTIAFDGSGKMKEYIGGYSDWLRQQPAASSSSPKQSANTQLSASSSPRARVRPRKLSYKEGRELDELPDRIDHLETEVQTLQDALALPETYTNGTDVAAAQKQLSASEEELTAAMTRWEELEQVRSA